MVTALDEPVDCDSHQRKGQEQKCDIDPKWHEEAHVYFYSS
jgi:hypothetical protein